MKKQLENSTSKTRTAPHEKIMKRYQKITMLAQKEI